MSTEKNRKKGIMNGPTMVTARRALGITKTYIVAAIFLSVMAIAVWGNVMYVNIGTNSTSNSTVSNTLAGNITHNAALTGKSSEVGSGTPLLAVPLDILPFIAIAIPVVMLFVYDKNNGVLEYLLSLGMTQRDIYMRYLKATLLLAFIFSIIFAPAVLAYTYAFWGGAVTVAMILPIPLLVIPFSLAVVAFMVIAMMAFSSLQKSMAGSNQPLGLIVGYLITIPGYVVPFIFSFEAGIYADLAIAAIIALVSFIFLMSSGKLIRREKFLP
jgi:hypothetical protein